MESAGVVIAVALLSVLTVDAQVFGKSNPYSWQRHNTGGFNSQYYANNSLVNKPVQCSEAQKACLARNMILHESSGRCVQLHERVGGGACSVVVDAAALANLGQVRSACYAGASCPGGARPLAFDGTCPPPATTEGGFCPPGYSLSLHPFGVAECAQDVGSLVTRGWQDTRVSQPQNPGECRFPNFHGVAAAGADPWAVRSGVGAPWAGGVGDARVGGEGDRVRGPLLCNPQQRACVQQGKVFVDGTCHGLLTRGPCTGFTWLVLDKEVVLNRGEMKAVCRDRTATGQRPNCPDYNQSRDAFGEWVCGRQQSSYYPYANISLRAEGDYCFW